MTDDAVRPVRLYDGYDPVSGPYFAPGRDRIAEPDERRRVAGYLRGGVVVSRSFNGDPDVLDPQRGAVVPVGFRTDGRWLWNDGLMYYVEEHGIAPDADFYREIRAAGYRCPEPDGAAVRRAARTLDRARGR